MKIRIVITLLVLLGGLLTIGSAALAVTGPSATGSLSKAQYGDDDDDDDDGSQAVATLGGPTPAGEAGGQPHEGPAVPGAGRLPESPGQLPPGARVVAPVAGGQLPFTGWATIPVLALGLVLLALGAAGRRHVDAGRTA